MEKETTVDERIASLTDTVATLAGAVSAMTKSMPTTKSTSRAPAVRKLVDPEDESVPVAKSWTKVVHKILGSDFSLECRSGSHGNFLVDIVFPKHIDRRTNEMKEAKVPFDVSRCMLRLSSPLEDLELWCQKVYENIRLHPHYREFTPKK